MTLSTQKKRNNTYDTKYNDKGWMWIVVHHRHRRGRHLPHDIATTMELRFCFQKTRLESPYPYVAFVALMTF